MVVVTRTNPMYGMHGYSGLGAVRSPTMIYPPNSARVAMAQQAAGGWVQVQRFRGLGQGGFFSSIPQWVWWAVGGVGLGVVGGFLLFRKRRK